MKTYTCIVLFIAFTAMGSYAQPDTTHRVRSADNLTTFFVGSLGPFDNWPRAEGKNHFGTHAMSRDDFRYFNLEDSLGMNSEDRGFWDFPSNHPAPKDTVLGGTRGQFLEALIIEPMTLMGAFENAQYVRFEFERHTLDVDTFEYPGFLKHPGDIGLIGTNQKIAGATFPPYLNGTPRVGDTAFNAIQLNTLSDDTGVFADSLWCPGYMGTKSDSGRCYFKKNYDGKVLSRKMLLRVRVKVNQAVDTTVSSPILFILTRLEKDGGGSTLVTQHDTVRVNSNFHHIDSSFDTVDIRFIRDKLSSGSGDRTKQIFYSFYWPKEVNAVFDYMELMTAHINSTDNPDSVGNIGFANIDSGEANAWSAEDFLAPNPVELGKLIHRIKDQYNGRVTFLRIGDEFPLSQSLPFQRLVKLVRDSTKDSAITTGQIEVCPFTVDSGIHWESLGIPDINDYSFEGSSKGWLDTSKYADPKMLFYDPYVFNDVVPLPKRTTLTDSSAIANWENTFIPTGMDEFTTPHAYARNSFNEERGSYLKHSQYYALKNYLEANRRLKRWTERLHSDCHFGIDWQAGSGISRRNDPDTSHHPPISYVCLDHKGSLRPPTGPEMKVTGNLTTSCGGLSLILYVLDNARPGSGGGENGGIMMWDGTHDSMYYTTRVAYGNDIDTFSGRLWMGFKERYDTVRALIPKLIKYGTTLLHATYLGDWTAAETVIMDTNSKKVLPFVDTSIRAYNDNLVQDLFRPIRDSTPTLFLDWPYDPLRADTTNRTFVHISMWLDTNAAAIANHSDTLLYITNMRTDDSYDTTEVPSTIDRRLITMRLKRPHIIMDVLNTNGGQLDNGRIWTPYVGAHAPEDSLKIQLLAGDGILIRLMDTVQGTAMHQMRYTVNFPKDTQNYADHGRLKFDRPVPGVKNITNDWSVPSSHLPFTIGIPDTSTAIIWQDSLLFQKFHASRTEKWRQHNWLKGVPFNTTSFGYKTQLGSVSTSRPIITSNDSIAHQIVINTDMEGVGSYGKIKFRDPFLVDTVSLSNIYDTLDKSSPFLPHVLSSGPLPGGDLEHYGGIFLKQNADRVENIPIYSLHAYSTIKSDDHRSLDTIPFYTDWVFMGWATNDTILPEDIYPWAEDVDGMHINPNKTTDVVFAKDSAIYTARYKAHTAAFTESYNPDDSGNCCNNQRKLYYIGRDSLGRAMYQYVYSSAGRIYTCRGIKTGTNNNSIFWENEVLISSWNTNRAHYPSIGYHSARPERYHYAFQEDSIDEIKLAYIDSATHVLNVLTLSANVNPYVDAPFATPAMVSTDFTWGPIDVVAWASSEGIRIKAADVFCDDQSNEILLGDETALYPTIWIDTCYDCSTGNSKAKFIVAWQQDIDTGGVSRIDIMAKRFQVEYGSTNRVPDIVSVSGSSGNLMNVSLSLTPASLENRRPCIAGFRVAPGGNGAQQFKIAYEANDTTVGQGIEIGNYIANQNPIGWSSKNYLTSLDEDNPYWKPSLEITKYQKVDTGLVLQANWYSLLTEVGGGGNIEHWAFDNATQRLTSDIFENLQDPQIAVTPSKIDSDLYRMAMTPAEDEPRWLISGYTGTYKLGTNDSLWEYRIIADKDSASGLIIESGIGEIAADAGSGFHAYDLPQYDDTLRVDSLHTREYFMRSEPFTLPAGGSMQYSAWVRPSNDSIRKALFGNMKFALDFYDTTGSLFCRIDSLELTDTVKRIHSELRTVSVNTESNKRGYAVFHCISDGMDGMAAMPNDLITKKRLSKINSYKRAAALKYNENEEGLALWAAPNPFRDEVNLYFDIPTIGGVTIDVFDALGKSMGYLCSDRRFTGGRHQLVWKAGKLPSGIYIARMRFGNSVISTRIIALE